MFKSAHRINPPGSVDHLNLFLACASGCIALHIALTAVWYGLLGDAYSMVVGFAVTAFLAYRVLSISASKQQVRDDRGTVAAALAWSVWGACHGADVNCWLPSLLLATLMAPRALLFSVLAACVALAAMPDWLDGRTTAAAQAAGLSLAIGLCIGFYRLALARHEAREHAVAQRMEDIVEAADIGFIELDHRGKVSVLSDRLMFKLAAPNDQAPRNAEVNRAAGDAMNAWRMLDLFHPEDHLVVARAQQQAAAAEVGETRLHPSCDCRLLRSDGSSLWVRAHFLKPASPARGTIATFVDIEDLRRAASDLRDCQRRLDAQNQELATQFEVSKNALHARQEVERLAQHDLKSPLKSIAAAASMLRSGRTLTETEEALLASIERTAGRALAIVSMSLDLYRMEEGTFRFVPETVDLADICRRVVSEIELHAQTKHVQLEFVGRSQSAIAVGNEVFITSVVDNLVRNAVEAAPEHTAVTLGINEGLRVGLIIHNEGAVPREIRENFFEKYVTHGKRDGLGLGTYSARLIARAQGGELSMSSSEQNGTTLTLELRRGFDDSESASKIPPDTDRAPQMPKPAPDLKTSLRTLDLLVVEDDDHNWLLLSSWLPSHIRARRAINGRDAIDALVTRRPDLVIMDLEMPVMNGFEALRRIREMQAFAAEKFSTVFAFTGYEDIEMKQRIESAGFDGILSKPILRSEFDMLIASLSTEEPPLHARSVWVEKQFADAFPDFIDSRRALIDDIEQAAADNDLPKVRRAAHTLAGSPAIHDFDAGIEVCREIMALTELVDSSWLAEHVATLRKILSNPDVR